MEQNPWLGKGDRERRIRCSVATVACLQAGKGS
jgi:hypothetical protein